MAIFNDSAFPNSRIKATIKGIDPATGDEKDINARDMGGGIWAVETAGAFTASSQFDSAVFQKNIGVLSASYTVPAGKRLKVKRIHAENIAGATNLNVKVGDPANELNTVWDADNALGTTTDIRLLSEVRDSGVHGNELVIPLDQTEYHAGEKIEVSLNAGTCDVIIEGDLYNM